LKEIDKYHCAIGLKAAHARAAHRPRPDNDLPGRPESSPWLGRRRAVRSLGAVPVGRRALGASSDTHAGSLPAGEVLRRGLHEYHRGTAHPLLHQNRRGRQQKEGLDKDAATHQRSSSVRGGRRVSGGRRWLGALLRLEKDTWEVSEGLNQKEKRVGAQSAALTGKGARWRRKRRFRPVTTVSGLRTWSQGSAKVRSNFGWTGWPGGATEPALTSMI
jgi:hypothetical protein